MDAARASIASALRLLSPAQQKVLLDEAAETPEARVREHAVVDVHGVLRGDDHAEPLGASLLQQRDQRLLRRRVLGVRWRKAVDLVEDEQRAQVTSLSGLDIEGRLVVPEKLDEGK